ncbi:hypothetical protein [Sediminibacterium ginsengisoli]|uniref:Uncharacterized protein n=1 Tax=Sediminibacterium ginsengisoli TaxID=413434 RepID=A0A1T4RUC1_9BACT|nr:hypothetical protein [Sediminibacterium ginsengisoli]SKA19191.1 hypothetical protein SAMN04488132_11473 [Sediminibacterium ginsengisoli]
MKKVMMALIAFAMISGVAVASGNKNEKKAETKKETKACAKKECKDKKSCTKDCSKSGKPSTCGKKC